MISKQFSGILLLATIFIVTAVAAAPTASNSSAPQSASSESNDPIPTDLQLRKRDADQDRAQDSETNTTENVKLLILPLIIRQRPIFIITDQALASDPDNQPIMIPSTELQPPAAQDRVDPNELWLPEEKEGTRDVSITDGNNDEDDSEVEFPVTNIPDDLHDDVDRRKRETYDPESSPQLYEIDQLKFGPILVNSTDPDTNETSVGVFSLDVVQISPVFPNATDDITSSRRERSHESEPSDGSKQPMTQPAPLPAHQPAVQPAVLVSSKAKRSAYFTSALQQGQSTHDSQSLHGSRSKRGVESPIGPKPRPFSRPLIQAPFRG